MPQRIDVPGMGVVEFPDGMNDDAIAAAIKQNMPAPQKPYKGSILPFSKDAQGNVSFDSDAGVLGAIKRAVTLPGDVVSGKVQLPSSIGIPGSIEPDAPGANEAIGRVTELAGLGSPMTPRVAASAVTRTGPPTVQELKAAGARGYEKARTLGVDINSDAVKNVAGALQASLERDGINGELAPKTFSIVSRLQSPPEGAVTTIPNLETVRRALGHAAGDFTNPTEKLAASRAIEHFDDYLAGIPAGDVLAGDAAGASKILGEARGNYAAAKRAEQVTDAVDAADLNAAAANSGQNIGNATRQRIKGILASDKKSRGYSPEELAQMERVVRGTTTGNVTRGLGNMLGGGGGLGAVVTAGVGGYVSPPLAALPLAGYALRKMSNASTDRQTRVLEELIRSRSPLADQMAASAPALSQAQERAVAAVVRALLTSQAHPANSRPF